MIPGLSLRTEVLPDVLVLSRALCWAIKLVARILTGTGTSSTF